MPLDAINMKLPSEILPYIRALNAQSKNDWIYKFVNQSIYQIIPNIMDEMFNSMLWEKNFPNANLLKNFNVLKKCFGNPSPSNYPYLKPWLNFIHSKDTLYYLQNALIWEIRQGNVTAETFLPSHAHLIIVQIKQVSLLLVMRKYLEKTLNKNKNSRLRQDYVNMKKWIDKEIKHLGPVQATLDSDIQRFTKLSDPSINPTEHDALLYNISYFFNGTSRFFLFLQYEFLSIKQMYQGYTKWVNFLTNEQCKFSHWWLYLPLASLKFCGDFLNLCLVPYRLVRTLANELLYLTYRKNIAIINNNYLSTYKKSLKFLCRMGHISSHIGLWLATGFAITYSYAWLPKILSLTIPVMSLSYYFSVMLGAGIKVGINKFFVNTKKIKPSKQLKKNSFKHIKPHAFSSLIVPQPTFVRYRYATRPYLAPQHSHRLLTTPRSFRPYCFNF